MIIDALFSSAIVALTGLATVSCGLLWIFNEFVSLLSYVATNYKVFSEECFGGDVDGIECSLV